MAEETAPKCLQHPNPNPNPNWRRRLLNAFNTWLYGASESNKEKEERLAKEKKEAKKAANKAARAAKLEVSLSK